MASSDLRSNLENVLRVSQAMLTTLQTLVQARHPLADQKMVVADEQRPVWHQQHSSPLATEHQEIYSKMSYEDQQTFDEWEAKRYYEHNARTHANYVEALNTWRDQQAPRFLVERRQRLIDRIGAGRFNNLVQLVPTTIIIGNEPFVLDTIFRAPENMTGWELFRYTVATLQTRFQEILSVRSYIPLGLALEQELELSEANIVQRVGREAFDALVTLTTGHHEQPRTAVLSAIDASDMEHTDLFRQVLVNLAKYN